MATSTSLRPMWTPDADGVAGLGAYALGAVGLAGEAIIHVQQYFDLFHEVSWIGPLFLANAVACIAAIAGPAYPKTRRFAALAGITISVVALGGLVISYGHGLFGWQEAGMRTAVVLILISEIGAAVFLAAGLAAGSTRRRA